MKKIIVMLLSLSFLLSASSAFALKSITYNGIECSYRNDGAASSNQWVPSSPGLYGFNGGVTYCPVATQPQEEYTFQKLSYAIIEGVNLSTARLCRRSLSGSVACGSSANISSTAKILYKPTTGSQFDQVFLSVNVGSGISLIRHYVVAWND